MKRLGSILGISLISLAVGLGPAFGQQTSSQGPGVSTAIQSKSDVKTPATDQASKDEKNLPAKAGPDVKAPVAAPSPKPAGNVKNEKRASTKTGTDAKHEAVSGKPAPDTKAGSTSSKTDKGAKDQKGTNAKPAANLKSTKPVKSASHDKSSAAPKHHAKKSSGKVTSKMQAKTRTSNHENRAKAGKS